MGIVNVPIIMTYRTPLGEYTVNENLELFYKGEKIGHEPNIPNLKSLINKKIDAHRKQRIVDLQAEMSELNGMSHDIEIYRVNPQF